MVDCPPKLSTGVDMILSLSVYMKPSAFKPPKISSDDKAKVMFNEGHETEGEQILRERKRALVNLFKQINLKPRKGNDLTSGSKLNQQDLELLTQRPGVVKPTQAASAGNGDDDDGEGDITEEQINYIEKLESSPMKNKKAGKKGREVWLDFLGARLRVDEADGGSVRVEDVPFVRGATLKFEGVEGDVSFDDIKVRAPCCR